MIISASPLLPDPTTPAPTTRQLTTAAILDEDVEMTTVVPPVVKQSHSTVFASPTPERIKADTRQRLPIGMYEVS